MVVAILAMAALTFASGCGDGDSATFPNPDYCPPGETCEDAGGGGSAGGNVLNPGSGGNDQSPGTCESVPDTADFRSFKGCMTGVDLSVTWRTGDHKEFHLAGKRYPETGVEQGEIVYLKSTPDDCGPVTFVAVSSSGSVEFAFPETVDWFVVDTSMASIIWMKLHNGAAPSDADMQSAEFGSLAIDIFECVELNSNCSLKSTLPGGWPTSDGDEIVFEEGAGLNVEGSECGNLIVVARTR